MKYTVYCERRVSFAVEVDTDNPASAATIGLDEMPGENLQDVDTAGDWEILSVTDQNHVEYIESINAADQHKQ